MSLLVRLQKRTPQEIAKAMSPTVGAWPFGQTALGVDRRSRRVDLFSSTMHALPRLSGGALLGLALLSGPAAAQVADREPVPSFAVLKGSAISPGAAVTRYGQLSPTGQATDGLCRDYSSNAQICPGGVRPRAPEIKELARALRGDPDLIYEYVRNTIETEFIFGAHKGALGATIDRSAGAFDQAQLMVELLREAGVTARFRFGDITLTGSQFEDWSGVRQAKAACELLAAGGVPATVDGSTSCALSGDVGNVTLLHVWVEAQIGEQTYQFDPSMKARARLAGIDVRAAMGLQAGEFLQSATQGASESGGTLSNLNSSGVAAKLAERTAALGVRLAQTDLQGANVAQALGGLGPIVPSERPVGGWRQASLAYAGSSSTPWENIPDAYRATLRVERRALSGGALTTYGQFFLDEISGRRLEINPVASVTRAQPVNAGHYLVYGAPQLLFDGVGLFTGADFDNYQSSYVSGYAVTLRLTIGHPFLANGEQYADETFERQVYGANPIAIVASTGKTSQDLASKWSREQAVDRNSNLYGSRTLSEETNQIVFTTSSSDSLHAQASAQWLAQFSTIGDINARLSGTRLSQLHTLGLAYTLHHVAGIGADGSYGWGFAMGPIEVLDLQTTAGVTSATSSSLDRRKAILALAATGAALEGSVFEQITNAVDSSSTARRFAWAASPETGETSTTTPRAYVSIAAGAAAPDEASLLFDGTVLGPTATYANGTFHAPAEVAQFKNRLRSAIAAYSQAGFQVVAVNDANLGPGYLHDGSGGLFNSRDRGGAFVAIKYDGGGEPEQVAHVVTTAYEASKGGGGKGVFDPMASAELLKDKFVDRSAVLGVDLLAGSVGYQSPVVRSIGQGDFPYKLEETISVRGAGLSAGSEAIDWANYRPVDYPTGYHPPNSGDLYSNFVATVTFANSGLQTMGQSRLEAAAPTIAALVAMQDIWTASASGAREAAGIVATDWWGRQLLRNVVNVSQGAGMTQYVRTSPTVFLSATGGPSKVEFNGVAIPAPRLDHTTTLNVPVTYPSAFLDASRKFSMTGGPVILNDGHGRQTLLPFSQDMTRPLEDYSVPRISNFARGVTLSTQGTQGNFPSSVTSSLGVSFALTPIGDQGFPQQNVCRSWTATLATYPSTVTRTFADAKQGQYKLVFRQPVPRSLTQRPDDSCKLTEVYTPGDTSTPALRYEYDAVGHVKRAWDALAIRASTSLPARSPHEFFIAEAFRGARINPAQATYAVETLPAGGLSVADAPATTLTRYIDELGRVTTALADGRGRLLQHQYPGGDKTQFKYDDRQNVVELRTIAKPNSGLADLVVTAAWDPTWNKPLWVKDRNQNQANSQSQTDFSYVTSGNGIGEIYQVTLPAVEGARPTWTYQYWPNGLVSQTTDPTGLVTTTAYDAMGNPTLVVADPSGLNIRTCRAYDTAGNLTSETDPRSAVCP